MLKTTNLKNKVSLSVPIWLLILALMILGTIAFLLIKMPFKTSFDNIKTKKEVKYMRAFDPERFKEEANMTETDARDKTKAPFDIKFPPEGSETTTGKFEAVNRDLGGSVSMLFSEGFYVTQTPVSSEEVKSLSYSIEQELGNNDKSTEEGGKKIIVKLNGVNAIAIYPYIQDNTWGEAYKVPASISWVKNEILYTVTSKTDPSKSLDEILEVAKLFN